MTPTPSMTKPITKTVLDLATFADVKLTKTITLPARPTTLEEALAAVGNDQKKLLNVVHEGLCADVENTARASMSDWLIVDDEDSEISVPYIGTPVPEDQEKNINGMILNFARMLGFGKGLSPEKKREIKNTAREQVRPILIATYAPKAPTAEIPASTEAPATEEPAISEFATV